MSDPIFSNSNSPDSNPLNRRDFIKSVSAIGIATAASGNQFTQAAAPDTSKADETAVKAYTNPLPMRKKKKSASIGIIKTLTEACCEPSSPITGRLPSHTFAANIIQKNNKTSFTIFSKASSTLSGIPNSLNSLKTTPMVKNGVLTKASQSSANLVRGNSNLS